MDDQTARVLMLALALFLPSATVIWKGSDLRGDLDKKWSSRSDVARAGLSERAVQLLRKLQVETDQLLGDVDNLDPDLVNADPGPLARRAGQVVKTIRVRDRLRGRFKRLVALGYAAPVLGVAYAAGLASAMGYELRWWRPKWLPETGYWIAGICAILGLLLVLIKFGLEQRLITAERMSRPPDAGKRLGDQAEAGDK